MGGAVRVKGDFGRDCAKVDQGKEMVTFVPLVVDQRGIQNGEIGFGRSRQPDVIESG